MRFCSLICDRRLAMSLWGCTALNNWGSRILRTRRGTFVCWGRTFSVVHLCCGTARVCTSLCFVLSPPQDTRRGDYNVPRSEPQLRRTNSGAADAQTVRHFLLFYRVFWKCRGSRSAFQAGRLASIAMCGTTSFHTPHTLSASPLVV